MLCSGNVIGAVDIFNAITGNWSTAVLSEGRTYLAAASLPNQGLAIFAGGNGKSCNLLRLVLRYCWGVLRCDDVGRGDACAGGVWCVQHAAINRTVCR